MRGEPQNRRSSGHGERARYTARVDPCRCERCRAANAAYIARYRSRGPRGPLGAELELEERRGERGGP